MNYEAITVAGAYAWGREDASGTRTVSPTEAPGCLTFAEAWSRRKHAFDNESLFYMPSLRDAYDEWQERDGRPAWADHVTVTR